MQKLLIVLIGMMGLLLGCEEPVPNEPSPKGVFPELSDEFGKIISVTGSINAFKEDNTIKLIDPPSYYITITSIEDKNIRKPIKMRSDLNWQVVQKINMKKIATDSPNTEYKITGYEQVNMGGDPIGIEKVVPNFHPDDGGGWHIRQEFIVLSVGNPNRVASDGLVQELDTTNQSPKRTP